MRILRVFGLAACLGVVTVGAVTGTAGAAPTGAKNAFTFAASCDGKVITFVVNSANGAGEGTMNNTKGQANFAPALVVGSNEVFIPSAFDLTLTFTTSDGQTFTVLQNSSKHNATAATTTCSLDITETSPDGTFSIDGTVTGRFV